MKTVTVCTFYRIRRLSKQQLGIEDDEILDEIAETEMELVGSEDINR